MDQSVTQFVRHHRTGVLATVCENGMPHAAAMHYSFKEEPLQFFFATSRYSKKGQALEKHGSLKAALVIGADAEEWLTLQVEGELRVITDPEQLNLAKAIHYTNNPDSLARDAEPDALMLVLVPTWWRYTNFHADPAVVIGSEAEAAGEFDPHLYTPYKP